MKKANELYPDYVPRWWRAGGQAMNMKRIVAVDFPPIKLEHAEMFGNAIKDAMNGRIEKRRIRVAYSCSDYAHHLHRWKWSAYLCGRVQYIFACIKWLREGKE